MKNILWPWRDTKATKPNLPRRFSLQHHRKSSTFSSKFFKCKLQFEKFIQLSTHWQLRQDFKFINSALFRDFDGGRFVLDHYRGITNFILAIYPFFYHRAWDVDRASNSYWQAEGTDRMYLEYISREFPAFFLTHSEWIRIDQLFLHSFQGGTLLKRDVSILVILQKTFPEFLWEKIWRFPSFGSFEKKRIWIDGYIAHHFAYVATQKELLGVSRKLFVGFEGGRTVLSDCEDNQSVFFRRIYYEFVPRTGKVAYHGYWANHDGNFLLQRAFRIYDIKEREDWYKISSDQWRVIYGKKVLKKNIFKLIEYWFPEDELDEGRFSEKLNKRSKQRFLGKQLCEVFRDELIFEDYLVKFADRTLEFDFYLPGMRLVVEYQGEQHYFSVLKWVNVQDQKLRDEIKRSFCQHSNLQLLYVPYWWDGSLESLKAILTDPTNLCK
eukprot:TRINITY_DN6570_c0_g1_i1.p1 TRINITY_DN6570_c0_g1~~TRINITY_DN6570_c0_g1_i1.p1  ORF type:complete len:438 (-),score=75.80 TRINITY_DN6570_c0_g1_i1:14-1327(-)